MNGTNNIRVAEAGPITSTSGDTGSSTKATVKPSSTLNAGRLIE